MTHIGFRTRVDAVNDGRRGRGFCLLSAAALIAAGLIAAGLLTGCRSSDSLVPEPVRQTPLELDPTENLTINEWWIGADRMIHLERRGIYTVYKGTNRYTTPIERGRWGRNGYYVIRLDPYQPLDAQPSELRLKRIEGTLSAQRPGEGVLRSLLAPPAMAEDVLIGQWLSDVGVLTINADLSYTLSPRLDLPQDQRPRAFLRHQGRWRFGGDTIHLERGAPDRGVITLRLRIEEPSAESDADVTAQLRGDGVTYTRVDQPMDGDPRS